LLILSAAAVLFSSAPRGDEKNALPKELALGYEAFDQRPAAARGNSPTRDRIEWRIVHEHFSAPFHIESGKALLYLKP
jgi:hypothetical protein